MSPSSQIPVADPGGLGGGLAPSEFLLLVSLKIPTFPMTLNLPEEFLDHPMDSSMY